MDTLEAPIHDMSKGAAGLKAAVTILAKWGATDEQGTAVLRVALATYARAKRRDPDWKVSLDQDQLTRISLVLNGHAALRDIVDNPENTYGFMAMANHNAYFDGRSPLEVIASGGILDLCETYRRIDTLREAQW